MSHQTRGRFSRGLVQGIDRGLEICQCVIKHLEVRRMKLVGLVAGCTDVLISARHSYGGLMTNGIYRLDGRL